MKKLISYALVLAMLVTIFTTLTVKTQADENAIEISAKKPVILVPGMMGSLLYSYEGIKNGQHSYYKRWIDYSDCLLDPWDNHLNPLRLSPNGIDPFMSSYQIYTSKKIGGYTPAQINNGLLDGLMLDTPTGDIWNGLIAELERNGYTRGVNLFAAPYDWRKSITSQMSTLQEVISIAKQRSGWNKVDIIGHSMGGLLTKKYLLTSAANRSNVDKFISVGSPFLGSVKSMQALTIGTSFCIIGPYIGINDAKVRELVKNYRTTYQLLPSKKYFDLVISDPYYYKFGNTHWTSYLRDHDGDADKDGDNYEFLSFNEIKEVIRLRYNPNPDMRNENENFHYNFDGQSVVMDGVKHYVVAGYALPTLYTMQAHDPWWGIFHFDEVNFGTGDATVPYASAIDLGNPLKTGLRVVNFVDHMELPSATVVINYIKSVLSSTSSTGVIEGELTEDEITNEVKSLGINGTIVMVRSDVAPTVISKLDSTLKIGCIETTEGLIPENTIKQGSYIQSHGDIFVVYVPGQLEDYEIVIKGTDIAGIQVREYQCNEIIKKDTIEQLDLTSTNGTLTLQFNNETNKLNIKGE